MAQFQMVGGRTSIEDICIESFPRPQDGRQRQIHLELAGWGRNTPPEISTPGNFVRVGRVSHDARSRKSRFWLEPIREAQGVGYVQANDAILRVTVGRVTNHTGMAHDLIADLGWSEDPRILRVYQRVLMARNNNDLVDYADWDHAPTDKVPGLADQPLKQITAGCDQLNECHR